jgi:hypothetical protein
LPEFRKAMMLAWSRVVAMVRICMYFKGGVKKIFLTHWALGVRCEIKKQSRIALMVRCEQLEICSHHWKWTQVLKGLRLYIILGVLLRKMDMTLKKY